MEGGLYCFGWNAAELEEQGGATAFVERAKALGLKALYMAGTYHAGWFLHPHSPRTRAYMTRDGAAYFAPTAELYGAVAPLWDGGRDWMRETRAACDAAELELWSWTIGTHNTPLGLSHPDACSLNVFGDVLPHALCPAHAEVRRYLLGLCQDLSHNVGVDGLSLESFGYGGWKHGHHHERELTGLSGWESQLMGLCFAPATMEAMNARGLDAAAVKAGVRALLDDAMRWAPDRPDGHPASMDEAQRLVPQLQEYMDARGEITRDIVREIRATIAPHCKIWQRYSPAMAELMPPALTPSAAGIYGKNADETRAIVGAARADLPPEYALHASMRLGMGLPASQDEFNAIARAAAQSGASRLVFYNASESPRRMLDWIPGALAAASAVETPQTEVKS